MRSHYQVRLLGTVEILVDGEPVHAFPSRAAEAIVALSAMRDRPVARTRLVDMLWPDSERKQAGANLRAILSALRRKLGDILLITRHDVAINWEQDVWVDARAFAAVAGDANSDVAAIEAALDLYRGDFLQDLTLRSGREFEAWAVVERERLRRLAVDALQRVVAAFLEQANYAHGIRYATQWLRLDPFSEVAHRQMMWLRMRNGERHLALEQFAACERLLAEEFGVEPTGLTRAVYERAVAMPAFGRNNFPRVSTPFIGRTAEVADLQRLFADPHTRLVTLLGPGGVGKTRLALAFGQHVIDTTTGRFLDGFSFVPLAAAYTAKAALFAIANAVDLTLSGSRRPLQQLLAFLSEREMMLILDNVEHLVTGDGDAAEVVEAILRAAPDVRLVVTSRAALRLYDEVVYDVEGLPVPAGESADSRAEAKASAAVQLYLSHVQRTQRGYEPDEDALQAIVTTCRLLDGVPLGIELAAAWVRDYRPGEIAAAVTRSLDFLTTPYRNVPPRQRSLRAAFDYSWHLLGDEEQALLAALSIFVGDFSADAARVAGATPALLAALRDKSLLRQDEHGIYSLHEMVRHFAARQLAPATLPALEAACAGYYAGLVAGFDRLEHYPSFQARLDLIQPQFANVLHAWEWLIERAATLPATEVAASEIAAQIEQMRRPLRSYFLATSQFYAGHDCFHAATQRLHDAGWETGTKAQRTLAAKIAIHDVDLARIMGDYHRAIEVTEPRLALLEADQAYADQASALMLLEESYRHVGRTADAQAIVEPMARAVHNTGRQELIAATVMERGHQAFRKGRHDEALALYQEALALFAPLENPRYEAIIHDYVGQIYAARGDLQQAVTNQAHALHLARAADLTYSEAVILVNLAPVYYEMDDVDGAFEAIREARRLLLKLNQRGYLVTATVTEGDLAAGTGDWARAAALYRDGLRRALSTEVDGYIARALARVPRLLLHQGKTTLAWRLGQRVLAESALARTDRKWVDEAMAQMDEGSAASDGDSYAGVTLSDVGALILRTALSPPVL